MNENSRLWFGIFVSLVFTAGAATGSLLERVFNRPASGPVAMMSPIGGVGFGNVAFTMAAPIPPGLAPPGLALQGLASTLAQELKLDDGQRKKIDAIFEARRTRLGELRDSVRTRFETERREIDTEIERVLTPDQRKQFHELNLRRPALVSTLPVPVPPPAPVVSDSPPR
jgi:Spy/CpxP family protein refolding chaperone